MDISTASNLPALKLEDVKAGDKLLCIQSKPGTVEAGQIYTVAVAPFADDWSVKLYIKVLEVDSGNLSLMLSRFRKVSQLKPTIKLLDWV